MRRSLPLSSVRVRASVPVFAPEPVLDEATMNDDNDDKGDKVDTPADRVILGSLETPTLTKAELSELLFDRLGLNKRESKDMVEAFFDIVHETLVQGQDVKLSGFGNFNIRRKAPRPGRNPRTGEAIPIKARNVVTFHASHKLKAIVQGDTPVGEDFE
jgi:integration host factor subunit alpha